MAASIKPGVRLVGIAGPLCIAWAIAIDIFRENGYNCVLTSGIDGSHSRGSIHYKGLAIDLRANHIVSVEIQRKIEAQLKQSLGPEFDVILENIGTPNVHYHIEFDPKDPINKES